MEVKSLRDLSSTIDGILKKYDIDGFISEFKTSFKKINASAHDQLEGLKASDVTDGTHFDKILSVSKSLSDEDLEKVVKISKKLNTKYKFHEFAVEAEAARKAFLDHRNEYFSIKATKGKEKESGFNAFIDQTCVPDVMLAAWINRILMRIYPYCLRIKYEDLNGEVKETRISHREPIVTYDYVECPLLARYHGKNNYDRFMLYSFYDANKCQWTYIPLRLIIDLTSPEGINIYDIDIID